MTEENEEFLFYQDVMDQLHCVMFHLYDTGLRSKQKKVSHNNVQKQKNNNLLGLKITKNKFNITTVNQTQDTLMDGFFAVLAEISVHNLKQVTETILFEEYDSDAIYDDVDLNYYIDRTQQLNHLFHYHSNVKLFFDNTNSEVHCYEKVQKYLYHIKLSKYTFSIGYRFYYWNDYINKVDYDADVTGGRNENHHFGFKPCQLFVKTRYKNLKHEICNNDIYRLNIFQYQISVRKAVKYISDCEKIKTLVYQYTDDDDDLHYGFPIHDSTPISLSHLLSICLYCDWSDLCTQFSSTFRKYTAYESISSVIKRNMEFANWSRLVRETVELYGKHYPKDKFDDGIKGPFFTGMSRVLAIPEFNIRLNSPTSTSKQVEIAEKFGGDDGIVIQLNNNGTLGGSKLRTFGCAFISNYAAEDEYLFCGGRFGIKVENIILQHTQQNFQHLIKALFYFDIMLNGTNTYMSDICDTDYKVLQNFVNHRLKKDGFSNRYPQYINNTFSAFSNHKRQLIINFHDIRTNKFKMLWNLIITSEKRRG
eukprot:239440_1